MFGVPYKMNEDALKATKNGCSALQMSATKNEDAKPLHKCICGGDENAEKLAETLGKTMNKRVAKQKLDQATKNYRDKKKAEEKEKIISRNQKLSSEREEKKRKEKRRKRKKNKEKQRKRKRKKERERKEEKG